MGNLQSSVNAALGTATKIEKLYKPLGQIEKQIFYLQVHSRQKARIPAERRQSVL